MSTDISPENEKFIRDALKDGQFSTREEALNEAVSTLRDQSNGSDTNGAQSAMTNDEWLSEYDAWIKSHESRNPNMDDSRQSIYLDRN